MSGIGLESIKLEIGRQATAVLSYTRKQLPSTGRLLDLETASSRHFDLYIIAFFKLQRFDHRGGQADR
jgi:hypothetical protein